MGPVRVLSSGVVNQIAAGEVVERPASVVKELVDNALDAGATRIEILIEAAGQERIAVIDDGSGMSRQDALLALQRHATSKIVTLEDLIRIGTLGFRGEALPSIAAVSRLALETAAAGGEGTRIRVDGGGGPAVEPIARARGTTVDVRSLFYNTPARRKFLKSAASEQATIVQRLVELAIARLDVGWRVTHGGREVLALGAARTLPERLASIVAPAYVETLLPLHAEADGVTVRGLIQRSTAAGASRRRQLVFVNRRPVDATELVRAAVRGYRSTLPIAARPDLYLFVELDPAMIDVNVHPAKREIRFRDPAQVAEAVEEAVRSTLGAGPLAARPYRSQATRTGRTEYAVGVADRPDPGPDQIGLFFARRARGSDVLAGEEAGAAGAEPGVVAGWIAPTQDGPAVGPTLWQLHNRFILAQTASGLAVIDQHSAHERVLYEEIASGLRQGAAPAQRLLFPLVLHLTPVQHATWESYRGLITRLGFEIEPFGGDAIAVSAAPTFRHAFDPEAALAGLLDDLGEPGGGSVDMNQHERVARLFACKAAIKAGAPLAPAEMTELIDRLFATRLPYDDVHGRPAVLQIALADLDRNFGRH